MANNNSSHYLMPTFDSEEAFNAYFAKETAAVAPYRDSQGHPEFTHTFIFED